PEAIAADPGTLAEWRLQPAGPSVLVIDDAHRLEPATTRLVRAAARGVPTGSLLVLAARAEPAVALARLRTEGLLELRASDLAMDDGEARQLLRRAGLAAKGEEVAELVRRTGGW